MEKVSFDGFRLILWDIDGTVFDFFAAQKNALHACFQKFDLGVLTESMLLDYDHINHTYWKALERGEITKPEVLTGRFLEFFSKYGIRTDVVDAFNAEYQIRLGDTCCYYEGARETLEAFQAQGIRQFAVTNGTKIAQVRKLTNSGVTVYFDRIFISEDVGHEKPNPQFFVPVWEEARRLIPDIQKEEILIIGDSLTSDMQLGHNVGIKTCWFHPKGEPVGENHVDYVISSYAQIAMGGGNV